MESLSLFETTSNNNHSRIEGIQQMNLFKG